MKRLTLAILGLSLCASTTSAQWVPPPGTYMPIPPPPRPDYYREWRQWGGRPVQPRYPSYEPQGPTRRCYYNVYRVLVCD
jgi:hypothetical protein